MIQNNSKPSTYRITQQQLLFCILLLLQSCTKESFTAQDIVDKAIVAAGGDIISNSKIHFKFRDYYYTATRANGIRTLERCTDKECLVQQDIIKKDGKFVRFRESVPLNIPDSTLKSYSNSINSVHYFSVLPYGLNDPAVQKTLISPSIIKGEPYYRIKVTFSQEGGGVDFEDEYMYWIHKHTYHVDYLAYNYQVNEGGTRFREAYNERFFNGIRFVDYNNFKPKTQYPPLESLDSLFESKKLDLLSKIELKNITVTLCPEC
ncbi:DUF6503 family protein [Dokdonia sp. Hel_I_53]|uniref:DUF6503 family protein n=1 Tax=Dokdonia sp. Hel_I_53 TaxID=1566287 RepID=UPI00119BFD98|nr:DUF6503 family protein [Dokdonia sp. Hel_I_53]TVZ50935.1 hypothetical protein OD90_0068 [Dokdonia sp. Hel_I_53]